MKTIVSHNLKVLKTASKMSAQNMADKFGVTRGYVEGLISGAGSLRADFAQKVCNYFGITHEQFTGQKLTEADLKPTGQTKTVTEVRLDEALKQIELLKEIIRLMKRKN